jgi:hypothetical protein
MEHDEGSVVLGRTILEEIWKDQDRLELPSFVSPAPNLIGSEKRKLSADQWRSMGTIHLVITLIRLWGFNDGRKGEMLKNFMHLITAIHIANLRTTSDDLADYFSFQYNAYLEGYKALYKESKIQPTQHLLVHFAMLLKTFGPPHAWRAWAFERFNYKLQQIKTNSRFGQLSNHSLCVY